MNPTNAYIGTEISVASTTAVIIEVIPRPNFTLGDFNKTIMESPWIYVTISE